MNKKYNKGFSLIEMLVVILILGIIAAISIPGIYHYIEDAQDRSYIAEGKKVLNEAQSKVTRLKLKYEEEAMVYQIITENLKSEDSVKEILNKAHSESQINSITIDNDLQLNYFSLQVADNITVIYELEKDEVYVVRGNKGNINTNPSQSEIAKAILKILSTNLFDNQYKNGVYTIEDYFTKVSNGLDSTGENYAPFINEYLINNYNIDISNKSYRLYYSKGQNNNTINIADCLITSDLNKQKINIVQYQYDNNWNIIGTYNKTAVVECGSGICKMTNIQ